MITDIEDFFSLGCGRCDRFATPDCSTRFWAGALADLRRICLSLGLVETVKWGHPCYMHAGRNLVLIGALRGDCRLSFFQAALMKDPAGVMEKQGPNTPHNDTIRVTDNTQVKRQEAMIRAYLLEAMGYAEAGIKAPREERFIELPDELAEALETDAELNEAFSKLTRGRQNSYVIALSSTSVPATRVARIVKLRPKILAGKGATER